MQEGFLAGLQRNWLLWSGWLFTVVGTVFGLAMSDAYSWIGALVAASGLLALTALAFERQKELHAAMDRHTAEIQQHRLDLAKAQECAEQAERKLNEVSTDMILRIQEGLAANSFTQCVSFLLRHTDYVERMVRFANQTATRPLSLRTFVSQSGNLYAVARIEAAAINTLKDGDPFVLTQKDPKGLLTDSARLVVHQRNETDARYGSGSKRTSATRWRT
jgi:hypothetical protein